MSIVGRTYYHRGTPVVVEQQWVHYRLPARSPFAWHGKKPQGTPRNVVIRYPNGEQVSRPFRGLRSNP